MENSLTMNTISLFSLSLAIFLSGRKTLQWKFHTSRLSQHCGAQAHAPKGKVRKSLFCVHLILDAISDQTCCDSKGDLHVLWTGMRPPSQHVVPLTCCLFTQLPIGNKAPGMDNTKPMVWIAFLCLLWHAEVLHGKPEHGGRLVILGLSASNRKETFGDLKWKLKQWLHKVLAWRCQLRFLLTRANNSRLSAAALVPVRSVVVDSSQRDKSISIPPLFFKIKKNKQKKNRKKKLARHIYSKASIKANSCSLLSTMSNKEWWQRAEQTAAHWCCLRKTDKYAKQGLGHDSSLPPLIHH